MSDETKDDPRSEQENAPRSPGERVASFYVAKSEMHKVPPEGRALVYDRNFLIPGDWRYRLARWLEGRERLAERLRALAAGFAAWLRGRDAARFRDRCDLYFWKEIVPEIEAQFGELAGPLINTINEAIINYAEHSFKGWSLGRKVRLHLFRTGEDLSYAILHARGGRPRAFDPGKLEIKQMRELKTAKRGWGHTLMMNRALFVGFDDASERPGMMIIVGPEESAGEESAPPML